MFILPVLKGLDTAVPVAALITRLIDNGWQLDNFLISSFHHLELKRIHPDIKLGVLVRDIVANGIRVAEDIGAYSVHPSMDIVYRQFVEDAHEKGPKVFVYTVDHPKDIKNMQVICVDGVVTGFPERVLENYLQRRTC